MEREEKTKETSLKKIFLSDVDGTLIQKSLIIDAKDGQAIRKWKEQGYLFGLVTGRGYAFCKQLMNQIGIEADVLITDNGAHLMVEDKEVYSSVLDIDTCISIFQALIPYIGQCYPFLTVEDGSHYFPIQEMGTDAFSWIQEVQSHLKFFHDQDLFAYLQTRDTPIGKISIYTKDIENTQKLLPVFKDIFKNVKVEKTSHDYIEIVNKETDKAKACQKLLEIYPKHPVYYIGDAENDIAVFRLLENTYVMDQADPKVKIEAKSQVQGIWQAIEERLDENV